MLVKTVEIQLNKMIWEAGSGVINVSGKENNALLFPYESIACNLSIPFSCQEMDLKEKVDEERGGELSRHHVIVKDCCGSLEGPGQGRHVAAEVKE